MATPFLIIDGYNLLHAAGMARARYGPGDLERARNWLIRHLSNRLRPQQLERTTVVFDAFEATGDSLPIRRADGLEIQFAPKGGDADTLIEELIDSHSAPRQLQVISSDHRLQKAARRRRATPIDSELFAARLETLPPTNPAAQTRPPGPPAPSEKETGIQSAEDTARWLELFGEVPQLADLNDDRKVTRDFGDWEISIDDLEEDA